MTNINILRVYMENFRRHKTMELVFEPNTFIGIVGKNGAGKSSLFMAMEACLYGESSGYHMSDMVNKKIGKNMMVSVDCEVGSSKYSITRYYKYKSKKNSVQIIKDGVDISDEVKSGNEYIESLILPKNVFRTIIYFSQHVRDFFTSLNNSGQKKIFDEILQSGKYREYYENIGAGLDRYSEFKLLVENEILVAKTKVEYKTGNIANFELRMEQQAKIKLNKILDLERQILLIEDSIRDEELKLEKESDTIDTPISDHNKSLEVLIYKESTAESKYNDLVRDKYNMHTKIESEILNKRENEILQRTKQYNLIFEGNTKDIIDHRNKYMGIIRDISMSKDHFIGDLLDLNGNMNVISRRIDNIKLLIASDSSVKTEKMAEIDKLKNQIFEVGEACSQCGQEMTEEMFTTHIASEIYNLEQDIICLDDNLKDNKESMEQEDIETIENIIKQKEDQITKMTDKLVEANKNLDVVESKISALVETKTREINDISKNIKIKYTKKYEEQIEQGMSEICIKVKEVSDEKESITKKMRSIRNLIRKCEEKKGIIDNLQNRIRDLYVRYKILREESIKYRELETDEYDINVEKKSLVSLKSLHARKNKERVSINKKIERLGFWKEAFSDRGIPSMMIDSSIPFLNERIKKELDIISPGKYIVSFDTRSENKSGDVRERFSVNVFNVETGADEYKILSAGERRQIDICCLQAMRSLAENLYQKKFNILLFDEVLDSLDDENTEICCNYLKNLSNTMTIVMISHSQDHVHNCDTILKI